MKNIKLDTETAKACMTVNTYASAKNFKKWLASEYDDTLENIMTNALRDYCRSLNFSTGAFELITVNGEIISNIATTPYNFYNDDSKYLDVYISGVAKMYPTIYAEDEYYIDFSGYMSDMIQAKYSYMGIIEYKRA